MRVIERVPGVLDAEGRQVIQVRASRDGIDWQKIKLISVEDLDQVKINLLSGIEGKSSPDRRELIVSHDFLNSTGFQVGDEIVVLGYYDGDQFMAGDITQASTGLRVMLRDPNGRPLWAGPCSPRSR